MVKNLQVNQRRYLRAPQAAEYTGLSVATIRAYVKRENLPFIKRGSCVLFDIKQLDAWMQGGQVVKVSADNQEVHE